MANSDHVAPRPTSGGFVRTLVLSLLTLGALALVAAIGGWLYAQYIYAGEGPEAPDAADRIVMIEKGSGVPQIAKVLKEAGAIENADHFRYAVRFTDKGNRLKAGEYAIPSGASLRDIIDLLETGKSILHPFTAAEGLTSAAIMHKLADAETLTGDLPDVTPAEGVLLPDTYMIHRGDTRADVLTRMISAQADLKEEVWPTRQPGLPFETWEEALILASIVEKETGVPTERPQVAAVFVNRLRRNMRLESDPTIIYGVCLKRPDSCIDGKLVNREGERRDIYASEIALDTGYNTYQIDRLPPTPICNPGRESIEAVLNPPVSSALFFVADGSGGHAFADTYAEHLRNVANWRKIAATRAATPAGK